MWRAFLVFAALTAAATGLAAAQSIVRAPDCAARQTADAPGYACERFGGADVRIFRGGDSKPASVSAENGARVTRLPPAPPRPAPKPRAAPRVTVDASCGQRLRPEGGGVPATAYTVCFGDLARRTVFDTAELFDRILDASRLACRAAPATGVLAAFPRGEPRRRACLVQTVEAAVDESGLVFLERALRGSDSLSLLATRRVPREGVLFSRDPRLFRGDADRF